MTAKTKARPHKGCVLSAHARELLERPTMSGRALRAARKTMGMSQGELAVVLRVSQGAVSAWELTTPPFAAAVVVDDMLREHIAETAKAAKA